MGWFRRELDSFDVDWERRGDKFVPVFPYVHPTPRVGFISTFLIYPALRVDAVIGTAPDQPSVNALRKESAFLLLEPSAVTMINHAITQFVKRVVS